MVLVDSFGKRIPLCQRPPVAKKKDLPQFCPIEYRKGVVELIRKHACQHPLIPQSCEGEAVYSTAEEIHYAAVHEMYDYCHTHGLSQVWAYLWNNWYRWSKWVLWARSACPDLVSVLRTTMILEGFWNKVKHQVLAQYTNPRLDLVIYLIITYIEPAVRLRLGYHLDRRRIGRPKSLAPWQKDFKRMWMDLARPDTVRRAEKEQAVIRQTKWTKAKIQQHLDWIREEADREAGEYHVDVSTWTCTCTSFLLNRFFLCKHLVREASTCLAAANITLSLQFFYNLRRERESPFFIIAGIHGDAPAPTIEKIYTPARDEFADDAIDEDGDINLDEIRDAIVALPGSSSAPSDPSTSSSDSDWTSISHSVIIDGLNRVSLYL